MNVNQHSAADGHVCMIKPFSWIYASLKIDRQPCHSGADGMLVEDQYPALKLPRA